VFRSLNRQFAERLKSVFLQTVQNEGDGSSTQRRGSAELAEKISGLWVNAKLFEKGLQLFDGKSTRPEWTVLTVKYNIMTFLEYMSLTADPRSCLQL